MLMKGITLAFNKQVEVGRDALNNAINEAIQIIVDDCLIAPITEPTNAREQQALEQSRDQVRIHLPKAFDGDVSDSDVAWGGKVFHLDSDAVPFMNANTPTRWNRYFRAECISDGNGSGDDDVMGGFFITEDSKSYLTQEGA